MSPQTRFPDKRDGAARVAGPAVRHDDATTPAEPRGAGPPTLTIEVEGGRSAASARTTHRRIQASPALRGRPSGARIDWTKAEALAREACAGLEGVSAETLLTRTRAALGAAGGDLALAFGLAAGGLGEAAPNYSRVAARLFADGLRREALSLVYGRPDQATQSEMAARYPDYFCAYVRAGVAAGRLDPRLAAFDLPRLAAALAPERDLRFDEIGLRALYDRYLLTFCGKRFELPQALFMRVAMGLALEEPEREARAVEFYDLMSTFAFLPAPSMLASAGTRGRRLSSAFVATVANDLDGVYRLIGMASVQAKRAGGLGADWTPVRVIDAPVKGPGGGPDRVAPVLRATGASAVVFGAGRNQAEEASAYLESWHIDVERFLGLGETAQIGWRFRPAHWIPDLFLQRVEADADWTLFAPDEAPGLHDLCGAAFKAAYEACEAKAERGEIKVFRKLRAADLWRRILTSSVGAGRSAIAFKDACNIRSPQGHVGVVRASDPSASVTLNANVGESAACVHGAVNLAAHVGARGLDLKGLRNAVAVAVRMLDNAVDLDAPAIPELRHAGRRHRPIGLGLFGYANAREALRIAPGSPEDLAFADRSTEAVAYFAIAASAELAAERGPYPTFAGSLWSEGVLPIDSLTRLAEARDDGLSVDRAAAFDWAPLRERVRAGLRNANLIAIAPTAALSAIAGLAPAEAGPAPEPPDRTIRAASLRQKWIDQAQSLTIRVAAPAVPELDRLARLAWRAGLKTVLFDR